jgi:hypothetical protein
MFRYPSHGERMERLEQEGTEAPDQHGGEIGVDQPGHAVGVKEGQLGVGTWRRGFAGDADGPANVPGQGDPDRRREPIDQAQGGGGSAATERGGPLDRSERRHGQSLAWRAVAE